MVAQVNRSIMHPVQIVQGVSNAPYAYRSLVQWFDCINFVRAIDPCMGSAHFLVYAFEVLMEIYTECGWSERDAAKSILENNLHGLEIDERAGQLAYFAVLMKARNHNRRILNDSLDLNIATMETSSFLTEEVISYVAAGNAKIEELQIGRAHV